MDRSKLLRQLFINPLLLSILMTYIQISSTGNKLSKTTDEMLLEHGYTVSIHQVTTSDGYKMKIHHILRNRYGKPPNKKYPVVIPHMLLGSSADWVLAGPDRSLAMQLADDGFDVWLGNYRGNTYGREHVLYKTFNDEFWDFSLHELGEYDLPAIIDFVITYTSAEKIHYVGYSMSTTILFIMASIKPSYQLKFKSCTLLAPVANIVNTTSTFKLIAAASKRMNSIIRSARHGELISQKNRTTYINYICRIKFLRRELCLKLFLDTSMGKDPFIFDEQLIPLIFGHFPAGTSSKLVQHYSQSIRTTSFTFYDYGPTKNQELYQSKTPPAYPLHKIIMPLTLINAPNDLLANPTDTETLRKILPNVKKLITVNCKHFNHFDFLFGKTVNEQINNPVKDIIREADDATDKILSIENENTTVTVHQDI